MGCEMYSRVDSIPRLTAAAFLRASGSKLLIGQPMPGTELTGAFPQFL